MSIKILKIKIIVIIENIVIDSNYFSKYSTYFFDFQKDLIKQCLFC